MKHLFILMLYSLFWPTFSMQPPIHTTPTVDCPGCICDLLQMNDHYRAFVLLNRFNSERFDISDTSHGVSLLHCYVLTASQPYFIKKLLEKGARLELRDAAGETPLITACRCGNYAAAQQLIQVGARVKVVGNNMNRTPLHWLCSSVIFLQDFKRNYVLKKNVDQYLHLVQALMGRAQKSLKDLCIQVVAEKQIKIPPVKDLQIELLYFQFQNGHHYAVPNELALDFKHRLQSSGAREEFINNQDIQGNTALHLAASMHAHIAFIRFLVRHGADRLITNNKGQTPADVAKTSPCQKTICTSCVELQNYLTEPQTIMAGIETFLRKKETP